MMAIVSLGAGVVRLTWSYSSERLRGRPSPVSIPLSCSCRSSRSSSSRRCFLPERQDDEAGYLELARNLTRRPLRDRPPGRAARRRTRRIRISGSGLACRSSSPALLPQACRSSSSALDRAALPLRRAARSSTRSCAGTRGRSRRSLRRGRSGSTCRSTAPDQPCTASRSPSSSSSSLCTRRRVCARKAAAAGSCSARLALAGLALTRVDYGWVLTVRARRRVLAWWRCLEERLRGASRRCTPLALVLCVPWLAYTAAETGRVFAVG